MDKAFSLTKSNLPVSVSQIMGFAGQSIFVYARVSLEPRAGPANAAGEAGGGVTEAAAHGEPGLDALLHLTRLNKTVRKILRARVNASLRRLQEKRVLVGMQMGTLGGVRITNAHGSNLGTRDPPPNGKIMPT